MLLARSLPPFSQVTRHGMPEFMVCRRPLTVNGEEMQVGDVLPADALKNRVKVQQLYLGRRIQPIGEMLTRKAAAILTQELRGQAPAAPAAIAAPEVHVHRMVDQGDGVLRCTRCEHVESNVMPDMTVEATEEIEPAEPVEPAEPDTLAEVVEPVETLLVEAAAAEPQTVVADLPGDKLPVVAYQPKNPRRGNNPRKTH